MSYIYLKTKARTLRLSIDEIEYIRIEARRFCISVNGTEVYCYRTHNDILSAFGSVFFAAHAYLLVNLGRIISVGQDEVILEQAGLVGMCRAGVQRTRKAWHEYIENTTRPAAGSEASISS